MAQQQQQRQQRQQQRPEQIVYRGTQGFAPPEGGPNGDAPAWAYTFGSDVFALGRAFKALLDPDSFDQQGWRSMTYFPEPLWARFKALVDAMTAERPMDRPPIESVVRELDHMIMWLVANPRGYWQQEWEAATGC